MNSFVPVTAMPAGVVSWPGPPSVERSVPVLLYSRTVCDPGAETHTLPDGSSAMPEDPAEAHDVPAAPAVEYVRTAVAVTAYTVPPLTARPLTPHTVHDVSGGPPAGEKRENLFVVAPNNLPGETG